MTAITCKLHWENLIKQNYGVRTHYKKSTAMNVLPAKFQKIHYIAKTWKMEPIKGEKLISQKQMFNDKVLLYFKLKKIGSLKYNCQLPKAKTTICWNLWKIWENRLLWDKHVCDPQNLNKKLELYPVRSSLTHKIKVLAEILFLQQSIYSATLNLSTNLPSIFLQFFHVFFFHRSRAQSNQLGSISHCKVNFIY